MNKTGSIYIIKNNANCKTYVGQTTMSVQERFNAHIKKSTLKNRHYKIYNAMNKYGVENFYFEVLESNVNIENLNKKEIFYICEYDSFYKGYNSTKGGDGRTVNKYYDEIAIKKLYLAGKTSTEIAKVYNVSYTTICRILHKLNVETRKDGNKYKGFNETRFKQMWFDRSITIKDMAKEMKVNEKTIRRNAKRLQLINKRKCNDYSERK